VPVTCPHIGSIAPIGPPAEVCEDCAAIGAPFVHRRQCLTCGHTGCCDASEHRHASSHHATTGHPIARSVEPGEDWMWCFVCGDGFRRRNGGYAVVDLFFEAGLEAARREVAGRGTFAPASGAVTPDGFPLGTWVATYRGAASRGELEPDQRVALEALPGWTW
jgi:hypothetical protein